VSPNELSLAEINERKQASRDEDERALAGGEKSREELRRENSIFAPAEVRVELRGLKRFR